MLIFFPGNFCGLETRPGKDFRHYYNRPQPNGTGCRAMVLSGCKKVSALYRGKETFLQTEPSLTVGSSGQPLRQVCNWEPFSKDSELLFCDISGNLKKKKLIWWPNNSVNYGTKECVNECRKELMHGLMDGWINGGRERRRRQETGKYKRMNKWTNRNRY